jgi:hypothetical protein
MFSGTSSSDMYTTFSIEGILFSFIRLSIMPEKLESTKITLLSLSFIQNCISGGASLVFIGGQTQALRLPKYNFG